jgi:hypothetical protein
VIWPAARDVLVGESTASWKPAQPAESCFVRGKFQAAADQTDRARLIPMQSSPEHILATAGDGGLEAWRTR